MADAEPVGDKPGIHPRGHRGGEHERRSPFPAETERMTHCPHTGGQKQQFEHRHGDGNAHIASDGIFRQRHAE
ncbi:hypothetical protein D3C87_1740800 [compost metagenome]